MLKHLKQKQNWFIELTTIIIIFSFILFRSVGNLDELWIFSYAKNVADGLLLYKDINMCVTPFAIDILGFALKIFGTNLWGYRAMTCLIYGVCYLIGSRLLWKKSNKNSFIHILYSLFFISMYKIMLYEYNILNIFFLILIIILEEKEQLKEYGSKQYQSVIQNIIIGLLIGLTLMTKQSTGVILIICAIINAFLNKIPLKNILYRFISFTTVISIYGISFFLTGAAPYVFDFTIAGVGNFTQNFNISLILKSVLMHMELLVLIGYYIYKMMQIGTDFLKKKELSIEEKNKQTSFIYMLASFCIAYPLLDYTHFVIACIPLLPYFFSELGKLLKNKKLLNKLCYPILGLWVFWNTLIFFQYPYYADLKICKINHYEGININSQIERKMENVINKIQEYEKNGLKTYILDAGAVSYYIPLDIYHKYYDLPLGGNLGTANFDELIKEICNENCAIFYVKDEEKLNYQMPKNIKFILLENGMEVVDECKYFDIYMAINNV